MHKPEIIKIKHKLSTRDERMKKILSTILVEHNALKEKHDVLLQRVCDIDKALYHQNHVIYKKIIKLSFLWKNLKNRRLISIYIIIYYFN